MKKIGLYFGSFNPIHTGHLIIAEYFATQTDLDEVWFVVSPHNPLKDVSELAPEHHRLEMVKMAIEGNPKLQACEIEFTMPRPSYTIDTLKALHQSFSKYAFTILLGEDSLAGFHLWKSWEEILESFPVRVFPRIGAEIQDPAVEWGKYDVKKVDAPLIGISSTMVRQWIKEGKTINYLSDNKVVKYISGHRLYA